MDPLDNGGVNGRMDRKKEGRKDDGYIDGWIYDKMITGWCRGE